MIAEPIRHGKTTVTNHGILHILLKDPTTPIIHLSHSFERATAIGKRIRQLATSCDQAFGTSIGPTRGTDVIHDWKNKHGGGVVVMSAAQSKLGYDCGCLIADDPIDEFGAQDMKVREEVDQALGHYTARTMRGGRPGSVLIVMSRWSVDDPIGRRLQRTAREWEYVSEKALIDEGLPTERAFAPHMWPVEELKKVRAELAELDPVERLWYAQFQADPRPPGADLFGPPTYYDTIPEQYGYRMAYGADLAFTQGEKSDYFALVAAKIVGDRVFLVDAVREKLGAHMIESATRRMQSKWGDGPVFSYVSGPEVGFVHEMYRRGLQFFPLRARFNKLVRAERAVHRWNQHQILVPTDGHWVKGFLHRIGCFRGNEKDGDDDEVDALVSLSDGAMGSPAAGSIKTFGAPYQGLFCAGARPGVG